MRRRFLVETLCAPRPKQISALAPTNAPADLAPHFREMTAPTDDARFAQLEGALDALKVVRPMTVAIVSVFLGALGIAIGIATWQLGQLGSRLSQVETTLVALPDRINQRMSEEFRAMRAEMAAQTSAIANSITAARQGQPQVIVVPAPPSPPTPESPRP